jgi:FixJ family two-component response regulator
VLALMMQGKSNKAICSVLELAEPTVKNHVAAILSGAKGEKPHWRNDGRRRAWGI